MSFPNLKTVEKRHLFGLWWSLKKEEDGWEDLGLKGSFSKDGSSGWITTHKFCGDGVNIGRNNDVQPPELFMFCKRCMRTVADPPPKK